jgi:hypothetical protein
MLVDEGVARAEAMLDEQAAPAAARLHGTRPVHPVQHDSTRRREPRRVAHHLGPVHILVLDATQDVALVEIAVIQQRIAPDERVDGPSHHAILGVFPDDPVVASEVLVERALCLRRARKLHAGPKTPCSHGHRGQCQQQDGDLTIWRRVASQNEPIRQVRKKAPTRRRLVLVWNG